jgi:hypothetical protein
VNVLAQAFNIQEVKFLPPVIGVDTFGSATRCLGILCDKAFLQVYDNKLQLEPFRNPLGLYTNYFLHHWQTMATSPLANAVALLAPAPLPPG